MSQLEKPIEKAILQFLRSTGIFCWKQNSTGVYDPTKKVFRKNRNPFVINGVSDILGLIGGRFLAIEVKSATGKLTEDQRAFIRKVLDEGGIAFVSRSVEQTAEQLSAFFPENKQLKEFCKEYVQSKGADH